MAWDESGISGDRRKSRNVGSLRNLFPFLRPYRVLIAGTAAALLVTALVSLSLPVIVREIIDSLVEGAISNADGYFVIAVTLSAILGLGTGLRYMLVNRLGERVVADIRKAVFAHVLEMSPRFYEKIVTGEVISRLTTDTTLLLSVISSSVTFALRNLLIFFGGLTMMILTSPRLTIFVFSIVPVVVLPLIFLGRRLRRQSRENQDWIAESSGNASEALTNVKMIQAFNNIHGIRTRFESATESARESAFARITTRATLTAMVIFLVFSAIAVVLGIGVRDVESGEFSPGELVQFLIYSVMVASAVMVLSEIWGELLRAAGATERLSELLSTRDTIVDPEVPISRPQQTSHSIVAFEEVSFRYPSRPSVAALRDVSFKIDRGETVALVGPSGSGKSTIFNLLLRYFDPDSGTVSISGTDLRKLARADFRNSIALVPQEPAILSFSVRENIRVGRPDATDEDVISAARAASAHDFISKLENGYDTRLGERGILLSGGQRQRIAIARAILRDSAILLLDEATSSLDSMGELEIQQALERLAVGRTTIIIAHRLATIADADRILVFEDGSITARGSFRQLMSDGGVFAKMAKLQFATEAAIDLRS